MTYFEWNFGHILHMYIGTDIMYLGQVFGKRDNWSGWPDWANFRTFAFLGTWQVRCLVELRSTKIRFKTSKIPYFWFKDTQGGGVIFSKVKFGANFGVQFRTRWVLIQVQQRPRRNNRRGLGVVQWKMFEIQKSKIQMSETIEPKTGPNTTTSEFTTTTPAL
jgi:hypothetical protein